MEIDFIPLREVGQQKLVALMNNPLVRKYMPLAKGRFTDEDCKAFIGAKEQMWQENGYGPWAFIIDGNFAGWGGLQPENGDADLAMVLHPTFWGAGLKLYREIIRKAFGEMRLTTLTALLPPSRKNSAALQRLGFYADGQVELAGETFTRFRLNKPDIFET